MMPIQNDKISVREVIVIETAASDIVYPIRCSTDNLGEVRRQAASITNVSSMPIPFSKENDNLLIYLGKGGMKVN